VRGLRAELKEFNGERDPVHLLVHYPPKVAVSKLVNSLKGVSARRIRQEFTGRINRAIMHGHLGSPSYFSASCGGVLVAIVRQYTERKNVRSDVHVRAVLRWIHPRRERRGFL
jgi:putative transposase